MAGMSKVADVEPRGITVNIEPATCIPTLKPHDAKESLLRAWWK
jgi:hypothetical protein